LKTKYSKASGTGGRKKPKTLSGIETLIIAGHTEKENLLSSRKKPKTLSGIETIY
jgi:hypothetical protein